MSWPQPPHEFTLRAGRKSAAATRSALTLADDVVGFGTHIDATISWAVRVGYQLALPGRGKTTALWEMLAATAAKDVGAARILEPHLDALAILAQAREHSDAVDTSLAEIDADAGSSWGVFAAEWAEGRLEARETADGWRLTGTKPWCSLANYLTHALVTAWVGDTRRLFAVDLREHEVEARRGPWHARGLAQVVSAPVDFAAAHAVPIGDAGWYFSRPGFAWGGMAVAAVWWGSALPLLDSLSDAASRPDADQLSQAYFGEADVLMWSSRAALAEAAYVVDAGADYAESRVLAERVRGSVAHTVERVLELSDHALGPGPLTTDEAYARRVSDLRLYLRQHHAERDLARLPRLLSA